MDAPHLANRFRIAAAAASLYAAWVLATYLLEGSQRTLLRPDATALRLTYTVVANMLIGVVGGVWILGLSVRAGLLTGRSAGFTGVGRSALWVFIGFALGLGIYGLQGAPTWDPVVVANVFAQVLVVSAAEVVVCWVVISSIVAAFAGSRPLGHDERTSEQRHGVSARAVGILAASLLFGVYHFAHSPPFNTISMVLLLSVVGIATGLFFFVSRNVYGTLVFHNMLGVYGVAAALASDGALSAFDRIVWPLAVTAGAAVLLLVAGHLWLLRGSPASPSRSIHR